MMVKDYPRYVTSKKVEIRNIRWPQLIITTKHDGKERRGQIPWKGVGETTQRAWGKVLCGERAGRWTRVATTSEPGVFSSLRGRQVVPAHCILSLLPIKEVFLCRLELPRLMKRPCWLSTPLKYIGIIVIFSWSAFIHMVPTHDRIHQVDKVTTNLISSARDRIVCESVICLTLLHPPAPLLSTWFRWGARRGGGGGQVRRLVVPGRRCLFAPRLPFRLTRYLQMLN